MSKVKDTAIEAALKAGEYLVTTFGHVRHIDFKGRRDLVTEADIKAEQIITQIIKNTFGNHAILAEEKVHITGTSDYGWIIDPIDGTTNFASQIPHFAISIGLLSNDEIILGVIYDPIKKEMFLAEKGKGASLNHEQIFVSKKTDLRASMIAVGLGYDDEKAEKSMESVARLRPIVRGIRMGGCASLDLAYVASGRFDIFFHRFLKPWDLSAGFLIVNEAGGEVIDFEERDERSNTRSIIAGNKDLIRETLEVLV
jgi:myo-inositol-1(or 4)-monophosphatase